VHEDVVPDTYAEPKWEAVEEKRLKPLLKPEQVGDTDILKVLVQVW